jgi:hypothetical protein
VRKGNIRTIMSNKKIARFFLLKNQALIYCVVEDFFFVEDLSFFFRQVPILGVLPAHDEKLWDVKFSNKSKDSLLSNRGRLVSSNQLVGAAY